MFPSSLRFFWSLQFSTGSLRGYPRVVPPGGLSGLWGQLLQGFLLLLRVLFLLRISATTSVRQSGAYLFRGHGSTMIMHIRHPENNSIVAAKGSFLLVVILCLVRDQNFWISDLCCFFFKHNRDFYVSLSNLFGFILTLWIQESIVNSILFGLNAPYTHRSMYSEH